MIANNGDTLWCEQCGETEQAISTAHAGLCDECFEKSAQEALEPLMGYRPCCTIVWHGNDMRICMVEAGVEHDHG